ncbi:50S ribosomal protein L30, partial [Bacillus anthracis]|uniref:50S ribosomal protein L30 n=1 Tax=Bacillus anthracis TaxID=1392 RepID=UPI0028423E3E
MAKKLDNTLTRSVIGRPQDQSATAEDLGLKELNSPVVKEEPRAILGMSNKVSNL